jgi:hypothetical protein
MMKTVLQLTLIPPIPIEKESGIKGGALSAEVKERPSRPMEFSDPISGHHLVGLGSEREFHEWVSKEHALLRRQRS